MAVTDAGSDRATEGMWATSQHSGNRPSDPGAAMTAPGSPSPSVDEADVAGQPFVVPAVHARTTIVRGDQ